MHRNKVKKKVSGEDALTLLRGMKTYDSGVVVPLRQAVKGQLSFYDRLWSPWGFLSLFGAPQDNGI